MFILSYSTFYWSLYFAPALVGRSDFQDIRSKTQDLGVQNLYFDGCLISDLTFSPFDSKFCVFDFHWVLYFHSALFVGQVSLDPKSKV